MSANLYFIEDYENETAFRPKKTNPNKPNLRKAKMNLKSLDKKAGYTLVGYPTYLACNLVRLQQNIARFVIIVL